MNHRIDDESGPITIWLLEGEIGWMRHGVMQRHLSARGSGVTVNEIR